MTHTSSIVILTGSPASGKTTLASRLAKAKPRGLHIPSDVFYTFPAHPISPYRPTSLEQNTDIIAAVSRTAAAFANRGYDVFLDGIFAPCALAVIAGERQSTGLVVQYVVLQAPLEIALQRVRNRVGHTGRDHVVRQMHAAFSDVGTYSRHIVDTSARDVAAVAADLLHSIEQGEFVIDLSHVLPAPAT